LDDQVQVRPELDQVVNPMREIWRRGSEMEMKSRFDQCALMCAHEAWWLFSELDVFKSRERLLEL